ncbi:MAG: hypothetical protein Q7R60_02400 [bacterium]|nr:hypothetical protein [bacterium]
MSPHLLYLASFIALLIPVFACLIVFGERDIKIHWKVIATVSVIGILYGAAEGIALSWNIWQDNPSYILGHKIFNAQIETYLLNFLLFGAIASSTVILMDRKRKSKK